MHGHPIDMDGDGDLDVVVAYGGPFGGTAPGQEIVWYENVGRPGNGTRWTKHIVGDLFQAFEAVGADLDGDGHPEIVVTAFGSKGQIGWFSNGGDRNAPWVYHPLLARWPDAVQPVVGDMDGDGKLDIVAISERGSLELRWWRNNGKK